MSYITCHKQVVFHDPEPGTCMLTAVTIENFKSYRKATLSLAPLTLLIGANASGKSNAIEALRFMALLALGRRLDDIFVSVEREEVAIRGTVRDLTYNGVDTFALGCSLANARPWHHFRASLRVEAQGMRIVQEKVWSKESSVPLYEIRHPAEGFSHDVQVAYNNFARGGKKPIISCTDQQAIFTQLGTPSRFGSTESRRTIPATVEKYREALRNILFLDPSPRRMREYSFITDTTLKGDGANISAVLYDLCERGEKDEVLQFIRHLPEQDIQDIEFLKTPRREVMVQLVETFAGTLCRRDAPLLSDGTLRVLSVAAAILSAAPGSLVVIEEIDNGVHPSRSGELLENIRQIATKRDLRVLLTSHNPALLDTLPTDAVPDVVCCYRDPNEGDSRLIRLEDLPRYPELVARGPLGGLMTKGLLDRFVKDSEGPAERKKVALDWLRELQSETV